ncbi:MAG: LolA family protein [Candidatus Sumerlaeaceae bacterium]|jgi:outer membrane lipoprotein-sorting protein
MKIMRGVVAATAVFAMFTVSCRAADEVQQALEKVKHAFSKVTGVEAVVETRHETNDQDVILTRSLVLSKNYGWKIEEGVGKLHRLIINDFQTNIVYYPEQKRALKLNAKSADIASEFKKPVTDLNPIFSLERSSLKLLGTEDLDGEKVYHFEGTTTTQFLRSGKPVKIRIEAWVAEHDGLPRKTIERWEDRTGTTIYRDIVLRDDLTTDVFKFTPPSGVEIIEIGDEAP